MSEPRAEAIRDQTENAFTSMLRRLYGAIPALLAAVLVDMEGECIDCVAAIDPFEAKVYGAHMHMLMERLRSTRLQHNAGDTYAFELVADSREVWVRRLGDDYVLVAILAHGFDYTQLEDAMARVAREFRAEVGIAPPSWEGREPLTVRLRTSHGWNYAPEGFSMRGERFAISAVLGRWLEHSSAAGPTLVCFRVRTDQGQELTLMHDERTEVWQLRD
jgi:predicted regulator of Ras-like GTPase activity (Roadblock/LC7/MglB family)